MDDVAGDGKKMEVLGKNLPKVMGGFMRLHEAGCGTGALDCKTKELISLATAVVSRCQGCIGFHVNDAIEAGATKEEIMDSIGVAIVMGGGPAVMHGIQAVEAYEQFAEAKNE